MPYNSVLVEISKLFLSTGTYLWTNEASAQLYTLLVRDEGLADDITRTCTYRATIFLVHNLATLPKEDLEWSPGDE